jgi:hypothetical protein
LSSFVITDIDDAIQYAIDNSNVDVKNIFVVGASGGGYAALGSYIKTRHKINSFLSWVPMTDLSAWHNQSLSLSNENYAKDIIGCTSIDSQVLDEEYARTRSPLFWDIGAENNSKLEIYAGINDGHADQGSVPISHSLLFFNHLLSEFGLSDNQVDNSTMVDLLTRNIKLDLNYKKIGSRRVVYENITPRASLIIFDGRHEMLSEYTFDRLIEISKGLDGELNL